MKKLIYIAILAVSLAGCATAHTPYYHGCFDGMSAAKFMLSNPTLAEPDMVDYYCKVVERNHDKTTESHK